MSARCSAMAACWSVCSLIIAKSMVLMADRSEAVSWGAACGAAEATAEAARACAGRVEGMDSVVPGGCLKYCSTLT